MQVGDNPWQYPYACKWDDYSRLLLVFTFAGSILLFRVPEPVLDVDSITRNQTIPLEEEEVRKKLRFIFFYSDTLSPTQSWKHKSQLSENLSSLFRSQESRKYLRKLVRSRSGQ